MGVPDSPGRGGFPVTRYSVIERIRDDNPDARRQAFNDLVEGYWKPVYKHLRMTWRLEAEEARDVTQGFFAEAYQKGWLERFEPAKARFRTFVRVCVDRFAMNARQAAFRLKRGGGAQTVSVDFDAADRELLLPRQPASAEPDEYFHQEFVRALFERSIDAVRREFEGSGRVIHFALFERYDLSPVEGVGYAQLAKEFDLTTVQVTNYLAQVRRAFRTRALEALRALCGSDAEYRREARELFGVEVE